MSEQEVDLSPAEIDKIVALAENQIKKAKRGKNNFGNLPEIRALRSSGLIKEMDLGDWHDTGGVILTLEYGGTVPRSKFRNLSSNLRSAGLRDNLVSVTPDLETGGKIVELKYRNNYLKVKLYVEPS